MEGEKAVLRAITDEIMYAILTLSGQEYVDRYAAEVKAEEVAAAKERARKFPGCRGVEAEPTVNATGEGRPG